MWQVAVLVLTGVGAYGVSKYLHGGYEHLLRVEPGDVVLDVGAHRGSFTLPAALKASVVVVVEPEPENASLLSGAVAENGLRNVVVVEKAAWNRRGDIPLYLSWPSTMHSCVLPRRNSIEVSADTLDNIMSELGIQRVDFIKMDIEGAEIEGAERVLSATRKAVIAAYHLRDGGQTYPWVREFLGSRGFKTQVAHPGLVHAWREG